MKKYLTGLFAVAAIGIGIAQASAQDMRPERGPYRDADSGFSFGIVIGDPRLRHHYRDDPYWNDYPVRPVIRACSVNRASAIARGLGIRHQTIFKSARTLKVVGTKRGHRVAVTFARAPGCPIVRY
jgi:hypothetical protein